MRIFFVVIITLFSHAFLSAQVGLTGAYFSQNLPEWEAAVFGARSNENLLSKGYSAELDYRFAAFENYRVEFYPALTFNSASSTQEIPNELNRNFDLKQYEFNLKTNIYFLSLEADCDCPTFSREAGILKKGLFFQLAPGISYHQSELAVDNIVSDGSGLNFKLGLGLGLEIGITDYVTVTPLIKYNRYFGVQWDGLKTDLANLDQSNEGAGADKTAISQFYGGIRLGFSLRR